MKKGEIKSVTIIGIIVVIALVLVFWSIFSYKYSKELEEEGGVLATIGGFNPLRLFMDWYTVTATYGYIYKSKGGNGLNEKCDGGSAIGREPYGECQTCLQCDFSSGDGTSWGQCKKITTDAKDWRNDPGYCDGCYSCNENAACVIDCRDDGKSCEVAGDTPGRPTGVCMAYENNPGASAQGCVKPPNRVGSKCGVINGVNYGDCGVCSVCMNNICSAIAYGMSQPTSCGSSIFNGNIISIPGNSFASGYCDGRGNCLFASNLGLSEDCSDSQINNNFPRCVQVSNVQRKCSTCLFCKQNIHDSNVFTCDYMPSKSRDPGFCDFFNPSSKSHWCNPLIMGCQETPQPLGVCSANSDCPSCYSCYKKLGDINDHCYPDALSGNQQAGICDNTHYNGQPISTTYPVIIGGASIQGPMTCQNGQCVQASQNGQQGSSTNDGRGTGSSVAVNINLNRDGGVQVGGSPGARFNLGDGHTLTVSDISGNSVTIIISSTPKSETLIIGQEWKVDVDDDNVYDYYVKVDSIENDKADLTIKAIEEDVENVKIENQNIITNDSEVEQPISYDNTLLILSLLILIVLFIIILVLVWNSKSKKRKVRRKKFRKVNRKNRK